ncbi:glutaminase A [Microthyrium microscopicum]|uniref:Glutaminase A n=1 Tax=Microthyrium microscopicum TaxID=703497 RepID=A0A6A6U085_9PEZI|nr:glutaminase A [Microthyrium microscopicum]
MSLLLGILCSVACASVLTPPVLPLFVRNPYLNAWLPSARHAPWEKWPMFYTGEYIGFGVLASDSNGTVYPLLGRPQDSLKNKGVSYNISFPEYMGSSYDASTTNLTYHIPPPLSAASKKSPVEITLSFLCPITPSSTLRQALPACYMSVLAEGSFDVSIYVDVNGQWVSGDRNAQIEWEYIHGDGTAEGLKTWKVKKQQEAVFSETADRAEWGTLYFSGPADSDHESGTSAILRQAFATQGTLKNQVDEDFRGIMEEEPVFAFSKTFKLSNSTHSSSKNNTALFTLAHVQDPVVQYASARGLTLMRPLWMSWFFSDPEMINFHYNDFQKASKLAADYDYYLALHAKVSGPLNTDYGDIVALSARQVMGATSFAGTPDNPILFLKEISSNGNSQTVDVIFPSMPFFLYTNPRWLAYLLEPLLEHQLSGQYPNKYSMHDMGTHFPNQTGHADGNDEYMPVEECGNMLIMALALANSLQNNDLDGYEAFRAGGQDYIDKHSKDYIDENSVFPLSLSNVDYIDAGWGGSHKGSSQALQWLDRSYGLLKQWTGYLVEFSLEPHNQLSTDDFAGWLALQTNLALKGIVGINAMSEIAGYLGHKKDADEYKSIAESYIKKWQDFAMSRDGSHAKLAYNWYGSWTTLYSLYADALLCFHPQITDVHYFFDLKPNTPDVLSDSDFYQPPTDQQLLKTPPNTPHSPRSAKAASYSRKNFIPHGVYKNQSDWYALVMQRYGLPLDSRHLYTKSDWEFEAAAVSEPRVRKLIVDRVARWINETDTDRPLTDLYETEGTGGFPGPYFMARPVVGGHFAILALDRACP